MFGSLVFLAFKWTEYERKMSNWWEKYVLLHLPAFLVMDGVLILDSSQEKDLKWLMTFMMVSSMQLIEVCGVYLFYN